MWLCRVFVGIGKGRGKAKRGKVVCGAASVVRCEARRDPGAMQREAQRRPGAALGEFGKT